MNLASKIILWMYRIMGIDIKPIIANERRFNFWATIWLVGAILGLTAGILGIVAAIYAMIIGV